MREVEVDPEAGVARSGGGATWLDFDAATQQHGLVTPGGVVGSTGVCGLTLGGGIGHLTAQHGLTCDNLVGAEIVLPDGALIRASADENPDLLWGLRGGGGNFGVATRLDLRLQPLERVVGGIFGYRGRRNVAAALSAFRDVVGSSPRDLSCQANLSVDEAMEPELVVAPCYTGPSGDPDELRVLSSAPGLYEHGVRTHSFLDQQRVFDAPYGEDRHYWKGHFVRALDDELIDVLVGRIVAHGRSPGGILIESLHGAPKDPAAPAAALGFRGAAFNVSATATWQDPAHDEESIRWARETAAAVEPWSAIGGGYVNYMQADEPIERVRTAFGAESFERLQALKTRFDPDNVLRRNQNVPPLGG
jgi:FAD/FMN-containing dehydrogenase